MDVNKTTLIPNDARGDNSQNTHYLPSLKIGMNFLR